MTEKEFLNAFEKATGARPEISKITIEPGKYIMKVNISDLKEFSKAICFNLKIEGFNFNFKENKMAFFTNQYLD